MQVRRLPVVRQSTVTASATPSPPSSFFTPQDPVNTFSAKTNIFQNKILQSIPTVSVRHPKMNNESELPESIGSSGDHNTATATNDGLQKSSGNDDHSNKETRSHSDGIFQYEDDDEITDVPQDFICPITQEIFRDPVQDLFGHTYERSAILAWIAVKGACPMTRQDLRASNLIPNALMKTKVRLWQREHHHQGNRDKFGQQQQVVYHSIYDTDDDETDNNNDGENVLIGYLTIPQTDLRVATGSAHSRQRQRQQRGGRWSVDPRESGSYDDASGNERPEFFLGDENNEDTQHYRSYRLDGLLEEYDRIIREEETISRWRRVSRQQQQREGAPLV
jgi:hypothetical protein